MHLNLETIISLIEIGTFALLTVIILNEYKKLRAKPLLYLAGSMGIFVVVQLIGLPSPANVDFNDIYIAIELMMLGTIYSVLFLILFIDSFNEASIANKRNIVLFSLVSAVETALVFAFFLSISLSEDIKAEKVGENLSALQGISILLLFISIAFATIMIVVLLIFVFKLIRQKISTTVNLYIKRLLLNIRIGGLLIVFGPIVVNVVLIIAAGISSNDFTIISRLLSPFTAMIGIAIIVINMRKGGLFIFQGDDLRQLLIIANSGIPMYGYSFRTFHREDSDTLGDTEREILFSGALKSITMLMSEFTGSNKNVKEIKMQDLVLIIRQAGKDYVTVLMTAKSTKFNRDALDRFSIAITDLLSEKSKHETLSTNQIKVANELLESIFGFTYLQQKLPSN